MRDIVQAIAELLARRERAALATVVRVSGSTPQQPGARLLLRADGSRLGTVGGGAVERVVIEALERALADESSQLLTHDLAHDLGMCCGGRMEIFVEALLPAPRLWLLGAGHVARPTAALAKTVGFHVVVVDEREELLTAERFVGCELRLGDPSEVIEREPLDRSDWLLIVTHDHQLDQRVLETAASKQERYVGLVGSRRKVFRLVQRVLAKPNGSVPFERLFAPVGLDIGAITPEEIAVSIVAELIALRRGQPAAHLRALSDERLRRLLEQELV
ncbi:MAG: XdhC family protein [Myxococcota bacterium]